MDLADGALCGFKSGSKTQVKTSDCCWSSGVGVGAGAVKHLCYDMGSDDAEEKGQHPEGPVQAGEVGLCEPHELQHSQVQPSAPGLRQSQARVEVGQRGTRQRLPGGAVDASSCKCSRTRWMGFEQPGLVEGVGFR